MNHSEPTSPWNADLGPVVFNIDAAPACTSVVGNAGYFPFFDRQIRFGRIVGAPGQHGGVGFHDLGGHGGAGQYVCRAGIQRCSPRLKHAG